MSALSKKAVPQVLAGVIGFFALAFVSLFAVTASARDITDMSGQTVTVPDDIKSVYAMTHAMPLLTAIAPDLAAGFGMPVAPKPEILRFLPPSMAKLPSLGGGSNFNLEKLKETGVDLALGWASPEERYPANQMTRIGIPVVNIDVDRLDQYPATLRFLGKLFHREARGEELARTLEETTAAAKAAVKDIPAAEKPKVFYADSIDGLSSQCDASGRLEVIAFAGGVNALDCNVTENYPIDIEKLLAINPDVIITRFAQAAKTMREDPRFAELKAVKAGRVYAIPAYPFNWIDRPPSFARALGVRWLAAKLYPDQASFDLRGETRKFYTLFFGVTPTDADLDLLFAQ